jgi:ppGpp synthetase/RelA/SpoT-type nucleotidyltranferase
MKPKNSPAVGSREWHKQQIEDYLKELPCYQTYAAALDRVLKRACAISIPEAIVQARPKSVSSFAEKCVRRLEKYPDPVHQLTDLCGGRVVVQTLEQVKAVKAFIEYNFEIVERDDKGLLLSEDKFGYRDMHYLVRLKPARAQLIGFTRKECDTIGERIAELQVRSVVQHAWADILHDRMYKTPLRLSAQAKRTGALLAAIMEDGDRSFDRLAIEIDGMVANYTAYAGRDDVEKEIAIQELILTNENDPEHRERVALQLARLLGPVGRYQQVVAILEPFAATRNALRCAVLLELGYALCRVHRGKAHSKDYPRGQEYLQEVVTHCTSVDFTVVPNLRKTTSVHARARSRLAWSWEAVPHSEGKARESYRKALELEPTNPYHLANQLGFEIFCQRSHELIDSMRTNIRQAIATCREQAVAGTELPYAFFTAGRLSLLLGEATQTLGWYARGLRHLFNGKSCICEDVLEDEVQWIRRIHFGATKPPELHGWVERLIVLARSFCSARQAAIAAKGPASANTLERVLIVSGGAASMDQGTLNQIRPALAKALENFRGTVISGGTTVGIPGCVGEIAAQLKIVDRKRFVLVGYIPKNLPEDTPKDDRYDRFVVVGEDSLLSAGQILSTWEDLLRAGAAPDRVMVLGFGGGLLTAVEFAVALSLGATVAAAAGSGGEADAILADPMWNTVPTLLALPLDQASTQALVTSPTFDYLPVKLQAKLEAKREEMAQAFHAHYIKDNPKKLPENMRPWEALADTFKKANFEQARYAVEILHAVGFEVRPAAGSSDAITSFADDKFKDEVERMAELEHGRWNVERLRDGWRSGKPRDDAKKIHDCLIAWAKLPENIKEYDRNAVRSFPEILTKAGLQIYQPNRRRVKKPTK